MLKRTIKYEGEVNIKYNVKKFRGYQQVTLHYYKEIKIACVTINNCCNLSVDLLIKTHAKTSYPD